MQHHHDMRHATVHLQEPAVVPVVALKTGLQLQAGRIEMTHIVQCSAAVVGESDVGMNEEGGENGVEDRKRLGGDVVLGAHDGVCECLACRAQFIMVGCLVCDAAYWFGVDGARVATGKYPLCCGGRSTNWLTGDATTSASTSAKRGRDE
jgi:hypothetical protein